MDIDMQDTQELGICPKCHGTRKIPLSDVEKTYSWNKGFTTKECDNCGAQRMYGRPSGKVNLRFDNKEPCLHEYSGRNSGRCRTVYSCKHCGDSYEIDSGD